MPRLSVNYRSGDAVGIVQEMHLYEDGRIRLLGSDWKTYCGRLPTDLGEELSAILKEQRMIEAVRNFGAHPSCPQYFVFENIEVRYEIFSKTARLDALEGDLLQVTELLEDGFKEVFGRQFQISILERLAELDCREDDAPKD